MKPGMIGGGIAAGFVATVVLSAMMLVKHSMGLMPELDPIAMITAMAGANSPALGWIAHFVIGSIFWGIGFAVVSPYLPGPFWLRGVIFAVGAWLLMMIVMMPMAGGWPVRAWSQHDDAGGEVGLAHRLRSGAGRGLWLARRQTSVSRRLFPLSGARSQLRQGARTMTQE